MKQSRERAESSALLIGVGATAGLSIGAASGVAVIAASIIRAIALGGDSTQISFIVLPFAALWGAGCGAVSGLIAGSAAALGARLAARRGRGAAGAAVGAAVGGAGGALAVLEGTGTIAEPWSFAVAVATAGIAALGLTRLWRWGTPFCRPSAARRLR